MRYHAWLYKPIVTWAKNDKVLKTFLKTVLFSKIFF